MGGVGCPSDMDCLNFIRWTKLKIVDRGPFHQNFFIDLNSLFDRFLPCFIRPIVAYNVAWIFDLGFSME